MTGSFVASYKDFYTQGFRFATSMIPIHVHVYMQVSIHIHMYVHNYTYICKYRMCIYIYISDVYRHVPIYMNA